MAKLVIGKITRFINFLTISVVIGGGFFIHILTALTIKSYYGKAWGYAAFMLPGFAELYLVIIQTSEQMYNYSIIIGAFLTITTAAVLMFFFKNSVISKPEKAIKH